MHDSRDILTLLGIPCEKVANFDVAIKEEGLSYIKLELLDDDRKCPYCNSSHVVVHGYYPVFINNSVIKSFHTIVEVNMRRYKCKDCGKTFKETFPFYLAYKKMSRAATISIKEELKEVVSYSYLARKYDVSTNTIISIFDSIDRQPKLKLSNCICIDEFHFSNNHRELGCFPSVISNPFDGTIIDVIESRKIEVLRRYFNNISIDERSGVHYFVSDMNETYRVIKKAFFGNAVHIIDHFHISKLFTNAIQRVRTRIMKSEEYDSKEYRFLKKHWKMFTANRKDLYKYRKVNKKNGLVFDWAILVDECLKKYPELNETYYAREKFNKYSLELHQWKESKENIVYFIQNFGHSSVPELNEIANTFSNWFDEIINSYAKNTMKFCLTNAVAEANNNNIQTLVDVGYGYGNFKRLRNRILYINRNK